MSKPSPSSALPPGLLALHGNRLEHLAEVTFDWLARHPLGPLDEEVVLVQSNGMAEWVKMQQAERLGISAATRVELPARFLWRAYRAVLGRQAVPPASPLDRQPLVWRCMQRLPALLQEPTFEPVARFLQADAQPLRALQLAQRLADLLDQYQVYRSDWLADWAAGRDRLGPGGAPVPPDQRWQPMLWRELLAGLPEVERDTTRPALHQRFLRSLQAAPGSEAASRWTSLPRRVLLLGSTHIPQPTLEALAALGRHLQVLLVVPNPCRFHWADLIEGRESLGAARPRHPAKGGIDLAARPLESLQGHGHPLLAAWGRQSRDFIRQLDAFDDTRRSRDVLDMPRVDLFDDDRGSRWLERVQARIRDLEPPGEVPEAPLDPHDRSIVFHSTHSDQREVEVLHDQLLHRLAQPEPGRAPLAPRDIVVMVPDIDRFASAIRSVFNQYPRSDPRYIPWGLADQRNRGRHPMLLAVEWLLGVAHSRFTVSELRELLEVPAVAARFGLDDASLDRLFGWIDGAGIRWGLDASQRDALGLGACADANSWHFGLQRLLMGYATGDLPAPHAGIEPYAEVGGLEAGLAGQLAECLAALKVWTGQAAQTRTPTDWAGCLRALLDRFLQPRDEDERTVMGALREGLADWLQACEDAGFDHALELAVVREAWLQAVDTPGLGSRFKAGGVTFCTLLPLRAVPFELVCLLGMNDGDFPRQASRSDFDLMALPGQSRPGDRSRREDDRQLMLDALLSARRGLYISWSGRSERDNQARQPSVLVAQLQDYLAAGWGRAQVQARHTEHPLQPFSRRYFEPPGATPGSDPLFTYASQWRSAHAVPPPSAGAGLPTPSNPASEALRLDLPALERFVRNPVKAFFSHRLQVRFDDPPRPTPDDETFALAGLHAWRLVDEVLEELTAHDSVGGTPAAAGDPAAAVATALARQAARGRLPLAGPGVAEARQIGRRLTPLLRQWRLDAAAHPEAAEPVAVDVQGALGVTLQHAVGQLRRDAQGRSWRLSLSASRLLRHRPGSTQAKGPQGQPRAASPALRKLRMEKLVEPWLVWLACAAAGRPVGVILLGPDVRVHIEPPCAEPDDPAGAPLARLQGLLDAAHDGLRRDAPLPTAVLSGLAWVSGIDRVDRTYDGSTHASGERQDACLSRVYPDAEALLSDSGFAPASERLYTALADWTDRFVQFDELADAEPGSQDSPADDDD